MKEKKKKTTHNEWIPILQTQKLSSEGLEPNPFPCLGLDPPFWWAAAENLLGVGLPRAPGPASPPLLILQPRVGGNQAWAAGSWPHVPGAREEVTRAVCGNGLRAGGGGVKECAGHGP